MRSWRASMREIPLTQGKVALVDAEGFEKAGGFKWYAMQCRKTYYALRTVTREDGTRTQLLLHRFLLDAPSGVRVDHEDGNGLNNVWSNLRLATNAENLRNRGKTRANTSGYKGVTWNKQVSRWKAQIQVDGHVLYLGYFTDPKDAADAYDTAAVLHFGEFARTNKEQKLCDS